MKVCIVGGGPCGMFLAILLKSRGTADDILVLEQNPRNATYGFGVSLARSAIDKLNEAAPRTMRAIEARMYPIASQVIENCSGAFTLEYTRPSGAITRLDLLQVLERRCAELGIDVRHDGRIDRLDAFDGYDLIVGADGANSTVRALGEREFGTRRDTRGNYFVWYGCKHPKQESGLRFRRYRGSAIMTHYYAYTPEMWTFVGELDAQSWHDLGMDRMTDAERKALCEAAFDDLLEGRPLIENKSNWHRFEAVVNERWSVGNRVLIGDALYRAHYSIGSGTRLAMEDALGLANALDESPHDIPAALAEFEKQGKPRKQKLMRAGKLSYEWYERFPEKLDMPVLDFILDFMNRTGRMPPERLRSFAPNLLEACRNNLDPHGNLIREQAAQGGSR